MSPSNNRPPLEEYRRKRDFNRTPEPSGSAPATGDIFVVQKHAASHLHYDFRLRLHGALKSWAVPKGPSLDPSQHRLADQTEDHPLEYAEFEGVIPEGNYGAGTVLIWDTGTWEPLDGGKRDYYGGRLRFVLHGNRLRGTWLLIRQDEKKWLLIKEEDEFAATEDALAQETSVVSGRTLEEIAADRDRLWSSERGEEKPEGFGHPLGESFPDYIAPQAATLVDRVPEGGEWLHEIKYDGFRMVCRIDKQGRGIRFFTRKGYDFTDRLHLLARAAARLPVTRAWLDGEIVVFTPEGKTDFHALQNAFRNGNDRGIVYLVFDLMNYEGYDLRSVPLAERKALLADLIPQMDEIRYVDHVVGSGEAFFRAACERKLEGVLSKQVEAEYVSGRSRRWLKVKCAQRQEFVVGGYTESGVGRPFGSLLAGYYDRGGNLVFAGKIKTGYSAGSSEALIKVLRRYEQPDPSFVNPPSGVEYRNPHWLRPELVAEVAFTEISGTGLLRHASFKGLREDKDAREVVLEIPEPTGAEGATPSTASTAARVPPAAAASPPAAPPARLSFGAREPREQPVYPHERIMREEIINHYALVADRMLPHIKDRPLTLITCRTNIYACKFSKHATNFPAPVKAIDAGHEEKYLAVDSKEGLLTLARMGVVEVHAWQSRYSDLEHPDRLLFDLDPPESDGFPWDRVAEAALRLRIHLQGYGLESFLQTTGGKGYYVVVPLAPAAPWKEVTGFARRISAEMQEKFRSRLTAKLAKEERGERIYLDWMRNGRGANAAEPFSLRARPGAPVAVPITWEELVDGVTPGAFHLRGLKERLIHLERDPWEGYFTLRQFLPPLRAR
ncbi:DNA ligase D [Geomesophilobacter sediminis]|uniref:DNA ligase (ATP) n=1 Tax=Geomesophilobacter sediminis TaxID=2798584 RepID=A0A8J7M2G6_9BACT|nr:DNA ligase D [Geomesophilobacter sediminis]MBJ6727422.1 DNA ligase D [Geomesophilobacter sediminis]